MKETVKYIDETTVEVEVFSLGGRRAYNLVDQYVPLSNITHHKNGDMSMNGDIKLFKLKIACLEDIKGLDLDKIDTEEVNRLYDKYFAKSINSVMQQGGGIPN